MKQLLCAALLTAALLSGSGTFAADVTASTPSAESLGWRLGVQAFSFNSITIFEAIDKVAGLNLKYIEAMPFGQLSPEHKSVRTDHNMAPEHRALLKEKLAASGVTLINYGVVPLPNNEVECRKVFDFAKDMDIETIVSEPPPDAIDLIAKLCDEYEINVAIHNHPIPSAYWDPHTVLKAVTGKTKRLGACADTSHWMRSGLDVVESLELLEGRIKSFHFGEVDGETTADFASQRAGLALNDKNFPSMIAHVRGIPNIVYGTGPADMRAWLAEIHRQQIRAVFSIEAFFHLPPDVAADKMRESIVYFESVATDLVSQ